MNKIKQLIHAITLIVAIGAFTSCEKTFDAPPGAGEVNIVANTSIEALKTYHTIPGVYDLINEDVIISLIIFLIPFIASDLLYFILYLSLAQFRSPNISSNNLSKMQLIKITIYVLQ